jgi:hypothetical protein
VLGVVMLAGCGLGAGPTPSAVKLVVTSGFGASTIRDWSSPRLGGEETVMSLLMRNTSVGTGDGFVQSIDGHAAGQQRGEPVGWFYFVNGVQAPRELRRRMSARVIAPGGTCTIGARARNRQRSWARFQRRSRRGSKVSV